MKLLIDTHLILWWVSNSALLSSRAHGLIGDPANTIFISSVSLWEIWLKVSLGKLKVPSDFQNKLANESFENLPLTSAQTRFVTELPWHHRDPFDRMLVAQAQAEHLKFLTADKGMEAYGESVLLC